MKGAGSLFIGILLAILLFGRPDSQPSIADSLRTIAENYAKPLPIPAKCR